MITIERQPNCTIKVYSDSRDVTLTTVVVVMKNQGSSAALENFAIIQPTDCDDRIKNIALTSDGWFTVRVFDIPNTSAEIDPTNPPIFKIDGLLIFRLDKDDYVNSNVEELFTYGMADTEHIISEQLEFVSTCYLKKCFLNYYDNLVKDLCKDPCNLTDKASKLEFQKRDILFMALNAVQYATDRGDYAQASQIINKLACCYSGLCGLSTTQAVHTGGCGCGC